MPFDPAQRLAELVPQKRVGRAAPAKPGVLVALSGGLDSVVLLHALAAARRRFGVLRACHVNHCISASAPHWSEFCARIARELHVSLTVVRIERRRPRGASLEEWAREQRYALLAEHLRKGEVLVTAQHADDQAETVLLQLLRGAGVGGLAGMPAITPFSIGWLARPMLQSSRAEILAYGRTHGLEWVEDESNADEALSRNYLRRQVMPLLVARWPAAATVIGRSASHLAEARELLDERAQADLARIVDGNELLVSGLKALRPARRRNALRAWFVQCGVRVPDTARLAEVAGPLLEARHDAHPQVSWQGVRIERHAGRLHIVLQDRASAAPRCSASNAPPVTWHWRTDPRIETAFGTIAIEPDAHGPIDLRALPARLEIRGATRGERLRLSRRRPSQAVRTLLQAAQVPVAVRRQMPRIWAGTQLVALGDRWHAFSIAAGARSQQRGRITVK